MGKKMKRPAPKTKPVKPVEPTKQDTGKLLVLEVRAEITPKHQCDYAVGCLAGKDMTDEQRVAFIDSLMRFAALGWAFFHASEKPTK